VLSFTDGGKLMISGLWQAMFMGLWAYGKRSAYVLDKQQTL